MPTFLQILHSFVQFKDVVFNSSWAGGGWADIIGTRPFFVFFELHSSVDTSRSAGEQRLQLEANMPNLNYVLIVPCGRVVVYFHYTVFCCHPRTLTQ